MKKLIILLTLLATLPCWAQNVIPANQSQVNTTQPTIGARFNGRVSNPRIWLDGRELTQYLRVNGGNVSMVPPYPLDYGNHKVQLTTANGQRQNWSFAVVGNNNNNNNNNQGNNNGWNNNNNPSRVGAVRPPGPNNGNNGQYNNGQVVNNGRGSSVTVQGYNPNDRPYNNSNNNNNRNNGQYINANGQRVNANGQVINSNGQVINNGQVVNNSQYNNRQVDAKSYGPTPNSVVTVPNPPISVSFNGPVQNLRMLVDGRDVTNEATIGNEGISWIPRSGLNAGTHSVQVNGTARNGQAVSGAFSFTIAY